MDRLVIPIAFAAVMAAVFAAMVHPILGLLVVVVASVPLYARPAWGALRDPIAIFGFLFPQLLFFTMLTGLRYANYADLMILGLSAWMVVKVFMGGWKIRRPPARYTMWMSCFLFWVFVSVAASASPDWSFWVAAHYVFLVLALMAVHHCLDSEEKILRFFDWLIRGSLIYSVVLFTILFQQGRELGLANLMWLKGNIHGVGTNAIPIPAIVCFPLVLTRFLGETEGRWRNGLVTLVFLLLIWMSLSRSAWLGAAVAGSACVLIHEVMSGRLLRLLRVGLVAGVLGAVILAWNWDVISAVAGFERGTTGRNYLWRAALQMISDHPFTGIGPGMWATLDATYAVYDGPIDLTHFVPSAHNAFLMQAAEMGIPAGLAVLVFVGMLFRDSLRAALDRRVALSSRYRTHLLGCFGVVTIIAVRSLFESTLVVWPGGAASSGWLIFVVVSVAHVGRLPRAGSSVVR